MSYRVIATACLLAGISFAAAQTSMTNEAQKPVFSAWTELVGDAHVAPDPKPTGHTVVRVITSDARCPVATADGHSFLLAVRQAASKSFPVTTCQGTPPASASQIKVGGILLKTEPRHLQRIIVIGDTGCRLKGTALQDCNDVKRWPFPLVAAHAAAKNPDLVIHVGDYYYRETPCPSEETGCAGSPHGDRWASWDADLFSPVAPLLTVAPWIFVRGNHEQCGRGADGWFRFLDAAPQPQRCEDNITAPPFTVRLDGLTLNIMDSADTDDVNAPANLVALWQKQLDQLGAATEAGHGWILTHRPIWGVDPKVISATKKSGGPADPLPANLPAVLPGFNAVDFPVNRTQQVASDTRKLAGTDMVLSGHVHLFTALSFGPTRPVQMVVGNGGDSPNSAVSGPGIRTEVIDSLPASIFQLQRYGYFVLDRTKDGWVGTAFSVDDAILGTCSFVERHVSCLLTPELPPQLAPTPAEKE